MPLKLGSTGFGSVYLGSTKIGAVYLGSVKVYSSVLVLPQRTFRVKYKPNTQSAYQYWDSATLVDSTNNIWDIVSPTWGTYGFTDDTNLLEVLGGNSTGITNGFGYNTFKGCTSLTKIESLDFSGVDTSAGGEAMFSGCTNLTRVSLLNTSNLPRMQNMFDGCTSLTQVPLIDTSNVFNCSRAFRNCYNVESGALALYNQLSTQTNVPSYHTDCFKDCGSNTVSGAAELNQIPTEWGGNYDDGYDDDFE